MILILPLLVFICFALIICDGLLQISFVTILFVDKIGACLNNHVVGMMLLCVVQVVRWRGHKHLLLVL